MIKTIELRKHVNIRENITSDQYVCGQVCNEYKNLNIENKIVMDIGGNIGAFAVYSVLRNCKTCISYEPDQENYNLFLKNTEKYSNVISNYGAITTSLQKEINFYETTGSARDGFSIIPFRGRKVVTVPSFNFKEELEKYRPECIKMDVEGAEFQLLEEKLPDYVKEFVVEIHFSKKEFRMRFPEIISQFADWECIITPKDTGKSFHTLGHWRR